MDKGTRERHDNALYEELGYRVFNALLDENTVHWCVDRSPVVTRALWARQLRLFT